MMGILEKIKNIVGEYGVMCIGIAIIMLMLYAIPWFIICILWWGYATLAKFEYSWWTPTIIWIIGMICIKILKKRTEKEIHDLEKCEIEIEEVG